MITAWKSKAMAKGVSPKQKGVKKGSVLNIDT